MTADVTLPTSPRDLRLDLFRGLANWAIFLGHIPDTALTWLTTRNYGFSDGADLFVFISGYTATLVFGRTMRKRGFFIGATRLFRRVWQLYAAHVLLFVFYMTSVHFLAHNFDIPHLMDQFNVAGLMEYPVETMTQGLLLKLKPLNLDVLPLYIVLMGFFPPVLWLMLRHENWVMLGSALVYLAARHYGWNFPSYPAGVWYFNPFTWQLLFVLGAWLVLGGASNLAFLIQSRLVLFLSVVYLLFALVMTLAAQITELRWIFPAGLFEAFNPNDKTNLAPYRGIHLASLILLVVRLIPVDWPGLRRPIFGPLIKCGQQSLEVFCVGVFLSLIAHFVLETVSYGYVSQLLVGFAGLGIMTGVAYYRSWSKRIDKPIAAH
ncbi:MAG: OpgC domain-containing protein [Bradyrhizobium sp.]